MAVATRSTLNDASRFSSYESGSTNSSVGPVTRAITAMQNEPDPPRRTVLAGIGAVLTGTIVGVPVFRAKGPDLNAVAEAWIEDARDLGMRLILGSDESIWRVVPIGGTQAAADAREAHWVKLGNRPRLRRAVEAKVRSRFDLDALLASASA